MDSFTYSKNSTVQYPKHDDKKQFRPNISVMLTDKTRLKNAIKTAMDSETARINEETDPSVVCDRIADKIAEAVIVEIKAMTLLIVGTAGANPITITSITIT